MIQDTQVEDTVLSTSVKDGVEGAHVKFLQVFNVSLVQSPDHTNLGIYLTVKYRVL